MLFVGQAYAQPPTLFYARCQPGQTRTLWLAGRHLWQGPEHVDVTTPRPTCTLERAVREPNQPPESYALQLVPMEGANGQDGNRGLPYLQRFRIPASVPADTTNGYIVRFRQNDLPNKPGQGAYSVLAKIPPANPPEAPFLLVGPIRWRDTPLVVDASTTFDGEGSILMPSENFRGGALVVLNSGATLKQCWVYVPEFAPIPRAVAFTGNGRNVHLAHVNIHNEADNGIGIDLRNTEDSLFEDVSICAPRSVDCNPNDQPRRNTFIHVHATSPRGSRDGQGCRGFGGEENLLLWCSWEDIDRGMTLSPQGSPLHRITTFECRQSGTGITEGASEGTLIESKKLMPAKLYFNGPMALVGCSDVGKDYVKPGYTICTTDGTQRWARIITTELQEDTGGRGYRCTLDKNLGTFVSDGLVGNPLVECSFIRPQCCDGKLGILLWGANINCAIVNGDFRDLKYGIYRLERNNPPGDIAFSWGLISKWNTFQRVTNEQVLSTEVPR